MEFENILLIGGIYFPIGGNWGQMCKWNLKMLFNWGHFFPIGGNWGQLGANGGKCVSGIRKCF